MEQSNESLCPCYKREIANKVIPLSIWRAFSLIFLVFHFSLFLDCLPGFLLSVSPSSPAPSSPSRSPSGGKSRSRRKSATSSAARAARRIHAARRAMSLEKPACSPGRNVQGTSSSCTNGTRRRGFPAHFRGSLPAPPSSSAQFCRIAFRSHPAFGLASARANPESGPQPARDFKPTNASEEASCSPCNAAIPAPWKVGFSPRAASATQQRGRRRTRCRSSPVRFPGPGAPRCAPCHPRKTRAPRRA